MAVKMSNYLATEVLKAIMKGENMSYSALYVSLHTAEPDNTGSGEVVAGGNTYHRKQLASTDWTIPIDGSVESAIDLLWVNMPAVTVTHIGLWDVVDGGNFLWSGLLNEPVISSAGDAFILNTGDIKVEIDPV